MSPSGLDRIARGLASGEISRRSALKRLAGASLGLGAAMAPAGVSEALAAGHCPPGRKKCGEKCCPKNAKCQNGKCKCKPGSTKCGKKCVDLQTDAKHCGDCETGCETGRACVDGVCDQCSTAGECPDPGAGTCQKAVCDSGTCGTEADDTNAPDPGQCFTATCEEGHPVATPVSPGAACNEDGGTTCDGNGACVTTCGTDADCGGDGSPCSQHKCLSNVCRTIDTDGNQCNVAICEPAGPNPLFRNVCCSGGTCGEICSECH